MKKVKFILLLFLIMPILVNAGFGNCPFGQTTFGDDANCNVQPKPKPIGGGDIGGETIIPIAIELNPFGIPSQNGTCAEKEQLYDGRCYLCDPARGYLEFDKNSRSILCIGCSEGYTYNGTACLETKTQKINKFYYLLPIILAIIVLTIYFAYDQFKHDKARQKEEGTETKEDEDDNIF